MNKCLNCGKDVKDNDIFCRNCGVKIQSDKNYVLINILTVFVIIGIILLKAVKFLRTLYFEISTPSKEY